MSSTTDHATTTTDDDGTSPPMPDPTVEPTTVTNARTAAEDKLWAALHATPNSTTEELATTAGIGRSTAAKILTRWTSDATVTRTAGTPTQGARRAADRWSITEPHAVPLHTSETIDNVDIAEPAATAEAPAAAETAHIGADDEKTGDKGPDEQTATDTAAEPNQPSENGTASSNGSERTTRRLAPGGLRGLIEDYLREHPDGEFSPSKIGKELERSSGAVSNALDKLVPLDTQ